jgi:hypothetical protein
MDQKLDWAKLLGATGDLVKAAGAQDVRGARAAAKKIDAVLAPARPQPGDQFATAVRARPRSVP